MTTLSETEMTKGNCRLEWVRLYYYEGKSGTIKYEIPAPHTNGYSHGWLLSFDGVEDHVSGLWDFKKSILLCPATLHTYRISPMAGEVIGTLPLDNFEDKLKKLIEKWEECVRLKLPRNFEDIGLFFEFLGVEKPGVGEKEKFNIEDLI